jgi:Tfp pilus assembly protein PilF
MVLEIDSSTGQPTGRPLTGPRLLVDQVAISDDGRWIAASSIGEGTLLWSNREAPRESVWVEREEKPPADLFEAMRLFYRGLGFDPTGATLAFARVRHSDPGAKHVWSSSVVEYDVGRKASTVLIADYPALVSDLASSRIDAGTWFAVAWDGTLHVLHADGREAHTRHIGGQPNRVCTLPTDVLVVADDVGQVTFWRDSEVLHRSREHLSAIEALACDREGRWVLTGDQSGSVRIWDAGSHVHLGELFHAGAAVSAIAQAPGSDTAVVLTAGGVALQVPVSQRAQTARACELAEALRFTRPGSEQRLRSVCSVPAPVRHDRTAAAAAYRSASGLLEAGRHDDALAAFRKAAAEHPTHAATRVGIGLALLHLERPAEALDAFDQAERLSGDRAEISLNRGLALRLLGDADAARLALERAIQLNPLIPEPYVQLADVLVAGGRLTEARSICARLEQEPALRRRQPDCLAVLPR